MSNLEKPVIEFPEGDEPEDLDILDIVEGTEPRRSPATT